MDMVRVGFRSGFQYGHRLPEFDGKCRRVHGHNATVEIVAEADRLRALDKEAVLVSLENLMTFPFVRAAVEDDRLTLHGLWTDTGEGGLEQFDPAKAGFVAV